VLFGCCFLRKIPWQHELGFEHRPGRLDPAVKGCDHPTVHGMKDLALHVGDDLAGVFLVPVPVQALRYRPELDQEVTGQILGSASPRFSFQRRTSAASSSSMMIRAS